MDKPSPSKQALPLWLWIFLALMAVATGVGGPYARAWVDTLSGPMKFVPFLLACAVCAVALAVFKVLNKPKRPPI